jgi:aspartate aminotransferase
VLPGGAFYLMLPLAPGADSRRAAIDLVGHGVAIAPGSAFGNAACDQLRVSLAASQDTLGRALDRILPWYEETSGGTELLA